MSIVDDPKEAEGTYSSVSQVRCNHLQHQVDCLVRAVARKSKFAETDLIAQLHR